MPEPLIIIQARLGSTRLPGKVLMSVGGRPMIWQMMYRLGGMADSTIATPYDEAQRVADVAEFYGRVEGWNGPENDVLARLFYVTSRRRLDSPLVRLTADCPLIDPAVIQRALDEYDGTALVCSTRGPDYATGYPDGQDVEVFSREMLEETFARVHGGGSLFGRLVYAEHPTLWMRENLPTHYLDHTPPITVKDGLAQPLRIKLSVDTWDDLQFVRRIVKDLGPDCTLEEIYAWATAQPERRPTVNG